MAVSSAQGLGHESPACRLMRAVTKPNVHQESVFMVAIGNFNPKIVEPLWLAKNKLVPEEEAVAADRQLLDGDLSHITFPWADLILLQDRLQLESGQEMVNEAQLRDLSVGLLRLLPHTPIKVVSIQHRVVVVARSEEEWHEVGHRLAPKELWAGILESPGMFDFAMQGTRSDELEGAWKVRVQPVLDPRLGVWINVNDEVLLPDPDEPEPGSRAADLIQEMWPEAEQRTLDIRTALYERLFG
jgi:hypothetical protein